MSKLKKASIYAILFALIFQLVPSFANAELKENESESEQEKTEVVLFAEHPEGEIELYDDESAEQVLVHIPDDTTVELLQEGEELSLIRYIENIENSDEDTSEAVWTGYVRNEHVVSILEADQFRANRETPDTADTDLSEKEPETDQELETDTGEPAEKEENKLEEENEEKIENNESNTKEINEVSKKARIASAPEVSIETTPLKGVALQNPTPIYASPSTASKVLKSYKYGQILQYRTFTSQWYEATVYINGKPQTGYLNKSDTGDLNTKLKGYALANPTTVYSQTSKTSKKLKSYKVGHLLQYQAYNSNWFKATVYVNGGAKTGYIYANDVSANAPTLKGYALKSPTLIYSEPKIQASTVKTYKIGSQLQFKPYNAEWYIANVYINGKKQTGYINKKDIGSKAPTLKGYAQKSPTNVYSKASKQAKTVKSYKAGSLLQFMPYNSNWYIANVYVNGKKQTGYIHVKDVGNKPPTFKGHALRSPTYIYSTPSRNGKRIKSYKVGSQLQYRPYNSSWHAVTVVVNGKKQAGYLNASDVGNLSNISVVNPNKVYTYNHMVSDIQSLQRVYPDLIKYKVVGKSEYGRNIYTVSLGKGPATTFINGSTHAREWLTTNLNMYMIEQYAKAYKSNQSIKGFHAKSILDSTTIWFIPMVNPDGVTLQQQGLKAFPKSTHASLIKMNNGSTNFKRWKANAKGVDLNRQYDAGWATIKNNPGKPSYQNYKGPAPASASEVKAVLKLVSEINPEMAVSYHSSGKILYWNYKQDSVRYSRDHIYAKAIGRMTGYSLVYPGPNPSGGGFTDWFISSKKRPAFTPEISRYVLETNPPLSEFPGAWQENQGVGLYVAQESARLYQARKR